MPSLQNKSFLALASMARDDLPASSTRGKVGSEFET